jgi:hypothetical protein
VTFLRPPDDERVVYEFFAPFAHVEGKYEWCRIRSPSHGVFDTFILVGRSPVVVYVDTEVGARFMRERYPECETFQAAPGALRIEERDEGRTVVGVLTAREGPVRAARMTLTAPAQKPQAVPYGGRGEAVWESKAWTCWGVDLVLRGAATGAIEFAEGYVEKLDKTPAVVTLGSFGRISPR